MPATRPLTRLLTVEFACAAALLALAPRVGARNPVEGLARVDGATTVDLAIVVTWWIAAAIAVWTIATTVICAASRAVPALAPLRALDALALPGMRRAIDRAFVLSLSASVIAGVAGPAAAAGPPVVHVTPDGKMVVSPATTSTSTTVARNTPTTTVASAPAPPRPAAPPDGRRPAPTAERPRRRPQPSPPVTRSNPAPQVHVVVGGDNLWRIAAARLESALRRAPTDAEIVPYWQRVIDTNRATLRSRDPNLIHPGEVITLPPLV
jgi:hypothetical protein